MATINVKDSAGSTVALEKPLTPGQALMAASRPVVIASDQSAVTVSGTVTANAGTGNHAITAASGSIASGAIASGAVASGAFASGALASGSIASGAMVDVGAIADAAVTAGATGSVSAKLRSISRDLVANIVLAAGTNAVGKLAANSGVDIGDVDVTTVGTITPGTAATSLGKAIDSAVGATDTGVAILAQRKDTLATHTPVDGDYVPLRVNSTGALHVTGSSGATEYTEDAAAASDPVGGALIAVRRDTLSTSEVSADGDNIALKATNKGKLHVAAELRLGDTVSDTGSGTGGSATQRVIIDSAQLGSLGQTTMSASAPVTLASDQTWTKGLSNKAFSAAFTTLTRPANTTAYTAADSISNNATAGSVTALSATVSDTNDDPIFISDILVTSTDTGLAGKKLRANLFNSDPTASTGVGAGDNAAYSQKVAGYIGSFMGYMETGFSDGTVGRLVPTYNETNYTQAGGFVVCVPTSGAKTLYIQYQAVEAFTPSANSTTIIGKARGWQGRAA